jgi:hypothetical protein
LLFVDKALRVLQFVPLGILIQHSSAPFWKTKIRCGFCREKAKLQGNGPTMNAAA